MEPNNEQNTPIVNNDNALKPKVRKIILAALVAMLAIIVVIYAQVIWQQYQLAKQAEEFAPIEVPEEKVDPSAAERAQMLEELRNAPASEAPEEERTVMMESLKEAEAEPKENQEAERTSMLEALRAAQ